MSLLLLMLACGSEVTYHQDLRPILEARCLNCHVEGSIGSVDLSTAETVQEWSTVIAHVTKNRSMPPWSGVGEFSNDWSLSDEQIALFQQWVDSGTPMGDPDGDAAVVEAVGTTLSRVDTAVSMPEPYSVSVESGDGIGVLYSIGRRSVRSILPFNAIPGNAEMVHHIAAFWFDRVGYWVILSLILCRNGSRATIAKLLLLWRSQFNWIVLSDSH